jgi:dipeptidyl-peptidase-3
VTGGYGSQEDCDAFFDYAAVFLSNIGNYYVLGSPHACEALFDDAQGSGDQKFTPSVSSDVLEKLSKKSPKLQALYADFADTISIVPPYGLGFPSDTAQSAYYPGSHTITREGIAAISQMLEEGLVHPENTRIEKFIEADRATFHVLQASTEHDTEPTITQVSTLDTAVQDKR